MEKTLNDIKYLIEKLKSRIDKALISNKISSIERDLMLDLLKKAYLEVEELKVSQEEIPSTHIEPSVAEEKQTEPGSINEVKQPEPAQENEVKQPAPTPALEVKQPETIPVIEVKQPEPTPVIEVKQPEPFQAPVIPPVIAPVVEKAPVFQSQTNTYKPKEHTDRVNAPVADLFGNSSLADKFHKESPSLNDIIISGKGDQSLAHQMQLKPISDLRTAIGINEKFQFVNDLFEGQIEKYNEAIQNLNNCSSGDQATWLLQDLKIQYHWKEETEAFNKIQTFIKRRYL